MQRHIDFMNINLSTENRAACNKVLPLLVPINREARLNGFDWVFVQGSTFVLRLNVSAKNPRLRQAGQTLPVTLKKQRQ